MPTLEELFKSKQLVSQGGKTAEEAYAVQNSKKIPISSSNPLVSTVGMLPAKGARALLGIKGSESLLEEELTGLRILRTGSIPFIYGTDIGRLTLRTTDSISKMKTAVLNSVGTELDANGNALSGGATGAFAKIGNTIGDIKSTLGLPIPVIPTVVDNGLMGKYKDGLGNPQDSKKGLLFALGSIKSDNEGTPLGKFLAKNVGAGTPEQMGRNAIGGGIKEGKKALGQKVFGSRDTFSPNPATGKAPSGITLKPSNEFPTLYTDKSLENFDRFGFNYGSLEPTTGAQRLKEDKKGNRYSKTIIKEGDEVNDLSTKQVVKNVPTIKFSDEPERASKFSNITKNPNYTDVSKENFLETKRGMYTVGDLINKKGVYEHDTDFVDKDLDALDFVTLKFTSLGTIKGKLRSANFRATISGLSETFSPSWDSGKFIGSPFNYYTYSGIERSVSFNFKVYSLDASEHKMAWDKLNFLAGLVYPADYYGTPGAVKSPIIKFTLGDMYDRKAGFIESLSYTIDDNTPWQVMDKEQSMVGNVAATIPPIMGTGGISQNPQVNEISMDGYNLPTIVDVAITIKFIENRDLTGIEDGNRKFYTFTPQTN